MSGSQGSSSAQLRAQAELERRRRQRAGTDRAARYQSDPVGYAREVLGVEWWHRQEEIARLLLTPPHRVLAKACHNVGKTYLAGGIVNWFFDSFAPGIALTTAPTDRQVRDLLWKEVRQQRRGRGGFPGPKMPRLERGPAHFAHGFTARDGDSFQGHHGPNMLFVFDEAVGVDPVFWETSESMFGPGGMWLSIFNPTDTSSQAYQEELSGGWHVISLSALEHPNIAAELRGEPPPYPAAIRLARLDELIRKWCRPLDAAAPKRATDIEWPPESGHYWRPGPIAEARLLGRYPSQATNNVWSDGAWQVAEAKELAEPDEPVEIGCDVARFGDDFTEIHVRRGPVSLHHEGANGWATSETAGRLKTLAREWGRHCKLDGKKILVKIDDDGVGGAVVDQREDYNFVGVSAASTAIEAEGYPNRRSELWFSVAERADDGRLSLARLTPETRRELRRQAMAPTWQLDSQGRRVVEPKDATKKRLKRSPDGMDALNLAYAPVVVREAKSTRIETLWNRR